jgi:hypothetical protein
MNKGENNHRMASEIDDQKNYVAKELEIVRREIEDSKERSFKIITGQVFALPIISVLSESISSVFYNYVFLIMPFVVLILVLTYIHEQHTIVRAGLYIRTKIEPICTNKIANYDYKGWENWLQNTHKIPLKQPNEKLFYDYNPREGDGYLRKGFWILSIIYYIFSIFLASSFLLFGSVPANKENMGNVTQALQVIWQPTLHQGLLNDLYTITVPVIFLIYIVMGIQVFFLTFKRNPISTDFC